MSLLDRVPGSGTLLGLREEVAEYLTQDMFSYLPNYEQIRSLAINTLMDTTAKVVARAGLGALVAPVGGLLALGQAINAGINAYAEYANAEWVEGCARVIKEVDYELGLAGAKQRGLAMYQPSADLTLNPPKCYTGKKTSRDALRAQYKKGWVTVLRRVGGGGMLYTPIPLLTTVGGVFGRILHPSIYGGGKREDLPIEWDSVKWWEMAPFAEKKGLFKLVSMSERKAAPPARWRVMVAPGLAPCWGPQGERLPTGPTMAALAVAAVYEGWRFVGTTSANDKRMAVTRLIRADAKARERLRKPRPLFSGGNYG